MLWMMTWMKGDKALLESYRSCYRSLREQTIADDGHMMHHDQPERFAAAIEGFSARKRRLMVLAVEGVKSFDYHCSRHLREDSHETTQEPPSNGLDPAHDLYGRFEYGQAGALQQSGKNRVPGSGGGSGRTGQPAGLARQSDQGQR